MWSTRDVYHGGRPEAGFEEGKKEGATHMIVVCDTFDYEDFPVYVKKGEDVREIVQKYKDPDRMSKVMEVYSYKKTFEGQETVGRFVFDYT
jgi:hypothetical protein